MKHPKVKWGLLAFVLALLTLPALPVGLTSATLTEGWQGQSTARAAAFDVEIIPPDGVQAAEDGGRYALTQPNTETTQHEYRLINHGEVTVQVEATVTGASEGVCVLEEPVLVLAPGETGTLVLTFNGAATGLDTTEENPDLHLRIEQKD